jgi:TolB-like protein
MGEVYRARDPRLEREVALKVLPAERVADDTARARLLREARLAARLNHPHICTIHEVGEAEGQAYVAMELVPGQALSERLASGRLGVEEVLRLGQQMADALAHAHENGVVHRDFKSPNVIVTPEGRAKVLDFGLAKPLVEAESEATTLTAAPLTAQGAVVGTLAYMAPEQLKGRRADARSDVWALGVVLYEMASGVRPFAGKTGYELSSAILNHAPSPLPADVSAPLVAVIERCLAKDPAQRYPRAGEVRSALETFRAGGTATARLGGRPTPLARRRWVLLAGLATVVAIAAALVVGGVWRRLLGRAGGPAAAAIRLAVLPFANLTGDPEQEYLSDGLTQELISQLGRLHPGGLSVIARSSVMRYKKGDTPVDQIGRELGVDYVLEGSARREGERVRITAELVHVRDQAQLWAETYERELSGLLALQSEVARAVARQVNVTVSPERGDHPGDSRQVDPRVYEAYLKGMFYVSQNTPESFEKGMRLLHQAVEIDPAEPLAYVGLSEGYVTLGHGGGDDPEAFPRARAAAEQALKLDPDRAEAVGALADVALYSEWDWPKAERLFQRALELNSSLAMTHYHYAWYLALFDRLDEAIAEHKRARDLDPLRALHTGWLGQLYNYGGRYDEAVAEARKALELNPGFWPSYLVLSRAYSSQGMHQEAIAAAKRLAEVRPVAGGAQLTVAYALAGQREQALTTASRLAGATGDPLRVARARLALGDADGAFRQLETAFQARWSTLPWIRVHGGDWEALRDEPRFQALLRKMNLPL